MREFNDKSPQRKVTACQSPGTSCATCTSRYIASDNDCRWCGSVTEGSTSGLCVSRQTTRSIPGSVSLSWGLWLYNQGTGPPELACLPLAELLTLIRTTRIIIGVVVGVTILNAICMGIYVKKRSGKARSFKSFAGQCLACSFR
jgi:hypothetical protein